MIAVITGDIINSTEDESTTWLKLLKRVLGQYGESPHDWEIFRGDSFQLAITPEKAMLTAFHIKSALKQTGSRDVRMGIGLGKVTHKAGRVSESNGPAYIHSGECFESLKKQTIALQSGSEDFDEPINLMLQLSLLTADSWSPTVSTVFNATFENPGKSQKELAQLLDKSQSSISEAMTRGGYNELMKVNAFYTKSLKNL